MKNSWPLFLLNRPENEIDIFSQFLQKKNIPKLLLRTQFAKTSRGNGMIYDATTRMYVPFYQIITISYFTVYDFPNWSDPF